MATATQKITLSSSRDIPFNKLVLSQSNARRVKAGISVEELAESIARRGLIQSLHVRPELDAEGKETGLFEVPAGGRRYRALELLVKQKRLNKTAPVPCIVSEAGDDILIDEVSLAENIERAPLHPLDQFRAFQVLREKGMSEEEIAAAFFVDAKVVKQRLRLVSVSPLLLEIYAEDGMTLEQLMAFTISDDHARQEQVWAAIKDSWQKEPYTIRRMLTETTVRASDKRALFVGIEAYEAAGGYVLRDLFQQDDGGWLQDPVLLDRVAGEKLKAEAETIAAEGWKWIEVAVDFPYGHTSGMRRLAGTTIDLSDEERAEREKLRDEFDDLEAQYAQADEFRDEVDARLGEIEEALEAFEARPMRYDADQMARAGVFVSIRHDGQLAVERGYVRADDEAMEGQEGQGADGCSPEGGDSGGVQRAVITVGGTATDPEEDEEVETIRPQPDRLVSELTAHRTLALRDAVAANPHVAMTALLHRLVTDCFLPRSTRGCLEAHVREVHFPAQAEDLGESVSARAIADRHEHWGDHIPADDAALWDWLVDQDDDTRMELLAHCVSFGVNALHEKPNPYGGMGVSQHGLDVRLSQADRLGAARRLQLLELAQRHGLTLIEDDYDHEYRFEGRPVLPLAARAPEGLPLIYVGSLSKLLSPGIRLGYALAPEPLLTRMAEARAAIDRQGDAPLEAALAELIRDGDLGRHARKARRVYRARRDLLAGLLGEHLAGRATFDLPAGGLALWLRCEGSAEAWAKAAGQAGLALLPGTRFALEGPAPQAFRLGYAALDEGQIARAVEILARSVPS